MPVVYYHQGMNFRAQTTSRFVDQARIMQLIAPRAIAAVTEVCQAVASEARSICPVDTGELQSSIDVESVSLVGTVVSGSVSATAPHAGFVEFGTGLVGAGTYPYDLPQTGVPYTGAWQYDYRGRGWKGMAARPYMRPALDLARVQIPAAFARQGFKI